MSGWLLVALIVFSMMFPLMLTMIRGDLEDALVALTACSTLTVLALTLVGVGHNRANFLDVPLLLSLLSMVGTLTFARIMERWL